MRRRADDDRRRVGLESDRIDRRHTLDGGITWSQEDGPYVAALEPAGGTVMRVAYTGTGCPGPCDLTVQTAPGGTDVWRSLTTPFQGDAVQLVRQGPDDAYVAVPPEGRGARMPP